MKNNNKQKKYYYGINIKQNLLGKNYKIMLLINWNLGNLVLKGLIMMCLCLRLS